MGGAELEGGEMGEGKGVEEGGDGGEIVDGFEAEGTEVGGARDEKGEEAGGEGGRW